MNAFVHRVVRGDTQTVATGQADFFIHNQALRTSSHLAIIPAAAGSLRDSGFALG
jgi:hypothetical protein